MTNIECVVYMLSCRCYKCRRLERRSSARECDGKVNNYTLEINLNLSAEHYSLALLYTFLNLVEHWDYMLPLYCEDGYILHVNTSTFSDYPFQILIISVTPFNYCVFKWVSLSSSLSIHSFFILKFKCNHERMYMYLSTEVPIPNYSELSVACNMTF